MKNIIDSFTVLFGLDTSRFKKGAKEVEQQLDSLAEKGEKTGESVESALSGETKKGRGRSKKATKELNNNLKESKKNVDKFKNSVSDLVAEFFNFKKMLKKIAPELTMLGIGYSGAKLFNWERSVANRNTPFYFQSQQLNTPISTLSGFGQAISTIGGNPDSILQALGIIGAAQTETRFFGTSRINQYLAHLGVPLANNGVARKPEDILLDLATALPKNIKNKRMTRQDAYNTLLMMGFAPDVANFVMQGRPTMMRELAKEQNIGTLSRQQVNEFKKVTAATADMSNAFMNMSRIIAYDLAPSIIDFSNMMTKIMGHISDIFNNDKNSKYVKRLNKVVTGASKYNPGFISSMGKILHGNARQFSANLNGPLGIGALIRRGESGGHYGAYNTGTNALGMIGHSGIDHNIKNMTLAQVMAWQANTKHLSYRNQARLFAVGAFQFNPTTLASVSKILGLNPNTKFDKKTQDEIAGYLIWQDAQNYLTGKTNDPRHSAARLQRDWTSLRKVPYAQLKASLRATRAHYQSMMHSQHIAHNTHVGTINVHTNATDGAGIAADIKKNLHYSNYSTPMQANYGLR